MGDTAKAGPTARWQRSKQVPRTSSDYEEAQRELRGKPGFGRGGWTVFRM